MRRDDGRTESLARGVHEGVDDDTHALDQIALARKAHRVDAGVVVTTATKISERFEVPRVVDPPLRAGDEVGRYVVLAAGREVGSSPIYVDRDVPEQSRSARAKTLLKTFHRTREPQFPFSAHVVDGVTPVMSGAILHEGDLFAVGLFIGARPELIKRMGEIMKDCPLVHYHHEIHKGADHGYALPDRDVFHKQGANRDWELIFAMFRRQLPPAP